MKKLIFSILAVAMMLTACTNKKAINSKDLQGRYEIDLSSLMSEFANEDDDMENFGMAIAAMVLSQIQMTAQLDGDMLIVDASSTTKGLLNAFTEESDLKLPIYAEYKIKNDSVLYLKLDGDEFVEKGVLRKMGESYDYLQYVTQLNDDDDEPTVLTLKKINLQ